MCGIVAFIANRKNGFNQNEVKAVKDLLYITSLRGEDSTGIFYITNSGDVQVHKDVGESSKFLKSKEWEASDRELFRAGQLVVGHCRHKTKGSVVDTNAHPFIVDNRIVLVHNGSFNGDHKHLADTEVDSHAIAHVLAEEDDIAKALSRVNAAYSLVWYNNHTKKLHAIRNNQRPLYLARMEDGGMLISSEEAFIYTAAWRNGLKIHKEYPIPLKEHILFTCNVDDINEEYSFQEMDCSYKPPVVFKKPDVVTRLKAIAHTKKEEDTKRPPSLIEVAEEMKIGGWVNAQPGHQAWRSWADNGSFIMAEASDYKLINEAAKLYYIFGEAVSPDSRLNGFTVGWEIMANSEEEVVQYITHQFFRGEIEYGMQRGIDLRQGDKVTAMFKLKEVSTIPAKEMLQ